ncbi:hypothetical protein M405DRAFT_837420 [Rhizopogon salebrosus TDB-379]|nr:hypothetical protein M405DRAFT_837420 [Rhizopogon salebrosus TDB-379]
MPPPSAVGGSSSETILVTIISLQIKQCERNSSRLKRVLYIVQSKHIDKRGCDEIDPTGSEPVPVAGWEPLTQPEGQAIEKAYEEVRRADISLHPSVELAMELGKDGRWGYYFADHDRRLIFWFEDHESEHKSHLMYALEAQYWCIHIELFPNKRCVPGDVVVRIKEFVMYAHAGSIYKEHEHSVWIVDKAKFANFCGQPGARLDSDRRLKQLRQLWHLSTLCAMGSLMVTIVLAGHGSRVDSGIKFMVVGVSSGIDFLAHMLSLPFALLIWTIMFFAGALSIVIFHTSDVVTLSVVSPIWAVIVILVTWPVLAQAGRGYGARCTVFSKLKKSIQTCYRLQSGNTSSYV